MKPYIDKDAWMDQALIIFCGLTLVFMLLALLAGTAHADTIPKARFVNAVIGEAEGEGYKGMLAVSCAIRNRGTLKGVYGEHAPRVVKHKYSSKIFVMAIRAYEESFKYENCEFIDGATYWEGTAFPIPQWADGMIVTATIGHQRFYRKMDKFEQADLQMNAINFGWKNK